MLVLQDETTGLHNALAASTARPDRTSRDSNHLICNDLCSVQRALMKAAVPAKRAQAASRAGSAGRQSAVEYVWSSCREHAGVVPASGLSAPVSWSDTAVGVGFVG